MPATRRTELIDPSAIAVPANRRHLCEEAVQSMMASIRRIGMRTPITIRMLDDEGFSEPELVTGAHRLEAMKRLGSETIECFVVEHESDALARLWEIDENLIRHPLSPAQEAAAIAERKTIYEELYPETKAGAAQAAGMNKALGRGDVGANSAPTFTESTVAATGKSERSIEVANARAKALGPDLDAVTGTSLDKGVELDALAKMAPEDRAPIIERARAGERVTARKEPKIADDPLSDALACERQVAKLMDAWNAAGPDARQEFMLRIDQPVFDGSRIAAQ